MIEKKDLGKLASSARVVDDAYVQIVDPAADGAPETRLEALARLAKGRRVLHVGCCDHIQLIDRKRADGTWLHDILRREAALCIGVDINREAVDYVRSLGIPDVHCADLTRELPFDPAAARIDLVVLGEIVEHLDAPIEFLRRLRKNLGVRHDVVVTVPNAFNLENFENAVCGYERINSDHRFWFTPYTIGKALVRAGYAVRDVRFVFRAAPAGYRVGSAERKEIVDSSPAVRDVLLAVAESRENAADSGDTALALAGAEVAPQVPWERHDIGARLAAARQETLRRPTFSFVVPVFGTEAFLPRCLDSLFAQTNGDFDVVVVNDGSRGNCRDIVARYGDRVRYFEHARNRSLLQARITGVVHARGEYVIPVDSDDFVREGLVAALAAAVAASPRPDVVVYHTELCSDAESRPAWHNHAAAQMSGAEAVEEILSGRTFWTVWGKSFRTDVYRRALKLLGIGEDFYLNSTEDLCQTIPMLLLSESVSFIDYSGYCYWNNSESLTKKSCAAEWVMWCSEENGRSIRATVAAAEQLGKPFDVVRRIRGLAHATVEWLLGEAAALSDREWSRVIDGFFLSYGLAFALEMLADLKPDFVVRWTPAPAVFPPRAARPIRRIAALCQHYAHGGAERANWLWMREMCARKEVLWLYDQVNEAECSQVALPPGLTAAPLTTQDPAERVRSLVAILDERGIDTVVLVDHWRQFVFLDLLAAKCAGCRVVAADHNSFLFPMDDFAPSLYLMRARFYPLADAVTALSPDNVAWFRAAGIANAVYMPNLPTFAPPDDSGGKDAPATDAVELLWVGRICPRKNPVAAIEALQTLKAAHPERAFRLTILGRYENERIREQVERNIRVRRLGESVLIPGEVEDVAAYYTKATILLVTSRIEGAPMVIGEAKSHGVPTVMYALPYVAGTDEADGVVRVAFGSTRALADGVFRLVSDPVRYRRLSAAAVQSVAHVREDVLARWRKVFAFLESDATTLRLPDEGTTDPSRLLRLTLDGISNVAAALAERRAALNVEVTTLKASGDEMRESFEHVVGSAVTWPFRMAFGVCVCLRQNGLGYTLRRIPMKVANVSARVRRLLRRGGAAS